jgi:hypothetical protein
MSGKCKDWTRLGDEAERVARFVGQRAYMRMEDGHCIALHPPADGGQAPVLLVRSTKRPQICRGSSSRLDGV